MPLSRRDSSERLRLMEDSVWRSSSLVRVTSWRALSCRRLSSSAERPLVDISLFLDLFFPPAFLPELVDFEVDLPLLLPLLLLLLLLLLLPLFLLLFLLWARV